MSELFEELERLLEFTFIMLSITLDGKVFREVSNRSLVILEQRSDGFNNENFGCFSSFCFVQVLQICFIFVSYYIICYNIRYLRF